MRAVLRRSSALIYPQRFLRTALPPSSFSVVPLSPTSARVSWAFADLVDADQIELWTSPTTLTGYTLLTTRPAVDGFYDITGLTAGSTVYLVSRGKIVSGAVIPISEFSQEISVTLSAAATPSAPTGLVLTETARNASTITFDADWDAMGSITGFKHFVDPSTDGGFESGSYLSPFTTVNNFVHGLVMDRSALNDEALFYVMAYNGSGNGALAHVNVFLEGNLKAPVFNSVIVVNGDDVECRWTEDPNAAAAAFYSLERDNGAGFVQIALVAAGTAQPQYTDPNQSVGNHTYRVRAKTAGGVFGGYSATKVASIGGAPPSGYFAGQDFRLMTSLADLDTRFQIQTAQNIFWDDGSFSRQDPGHVGQPSGHRGLIYRYIPKNQPAFTLSQICNDQSLVVKFSFGDTGGFLDVHFKFRLIFADSWDVTHPDCGTAPQPDFKTFLCYPQPTVTGNQRAELKVGTSGTKLHATGMGGVSLATKVPSKIYAPSTPISAPQLWDDQPHDYLVHFGLLQNPAVANRWEDIVQIMVDGQLTHSFRGVGNQNLGTSRFKFLKMLANRNQNTAVESYVWVEEAYVWPTVLGDPGWFDGIGIKDYANLGGAEYIP